MPLRLRGYIRPAIFSRTVYILGLNAHHADSSAAIYKDGVLIAATEEERFRRIKHWAGFPSMAIEFCLKEAGLMLDEVDFITIGRDPLAPSFLCVFRPSRWVFFNAS